MLNPIMPVRFLSAIPAVYLWLNTVALLAAFLGVSGCSEGHPSETPIGEPIRFGLANAPMNLDPRAATDAASARVNRLLYARLVDFDESATPIPALATWRRLSPTHYRFRLGQRNRHFHHGGRLTSQDVKATYESILDPRQASPHRNTLTIIDRIETPSEELVDFHLHRADLLFPGYLVIGILPRNLIDRGHPFHDRPVGSGPFTFDGRPDGTRLRLIRRDDGQLFEFIRIPDSTVRVLKLLAGEIDMVQNDLPPELIGYLAKKAQLHVQRRRGANFAYLGFNLADPVAGLLDVRRAVAHAIDRESLLRYVLQGGTLANALFGPQHWAGDPNLTGYAFDPERARALLQEAGFHADRPVRLVYKTSTDPFRLRLATILQQQLARVGIHVTIESHDWGTFYGDIKAGRFQLYSLVWVGVKTPDIFRYIFHSSSIPPNGANRGRFADPAVDDLIERAEASQDFEEKRLLYRALQALLLQRLPYVPLWYEDHVFIADRRITGYRLAPDGNYDGLVNVNRRNPNGSRL